MPIGAACSHSNELNPLRATPAFAATARQAPASTPSRACFVFIRARRAGALRRRVDSWLKTIEDGVRRLGPSRTGIRVSPYRFRVRHRRRRSCSSWRLVAPDFSLSKPRQIVIAGKRDDAGTKALLAEVHQHFIPNKILILADGAEGQK